MAETIDSARCQTERDRMLDSDLSRRVHQSGRDRQQHALAETPRLTGTNSDALLAAMPAQILITRDFPVPPWCGDPERSLKAFWMPLPVYGKRFRPCPDAGTGGREPSYALRREPEAVTGRIVAGLPCTRRSRLPGGFAHDREGAALWRD